VFHPFLAISVCSYIGWMSRLIKSKTHPEANLVRMHALVTWYRRSQHDALFERLSKSEEGREFIAALFPQFECEAAVEEEEKKSKTTIKFAPSCGDVTIPERRNNRRAEKYARNSRKAIALHEFCLEAFPDYRGEFEHLGSVPDLEYVCVRGSLFVGGMRRLGGRYPEPDVLGVAGTPRYKQNSCFVPCCGLEGEHQPGRNRWPRPKCDCYHGPAH
jgi:hypothetical protein